MDTGRQLLEGKGEIKAQPNLCGEGSGTHGRSGVGLVVLVVSSMPPPKRRKPSKSASSSKGKERKLNLLVYSPKKTSQS